jgi:hypothetical protein
MSYSLVQSDGNGIFNIKIYLEKKLIPDSVMID